MAAAAPISTVYVQNLEERVKPDTLSNTLNILFKQFGNVVDIVIKTNLRAKGQAFVVYDKEDSAKEAIEEIDGFPLFDKPMRLAMAKSRSDKTVELTSSPEDLEAHKQHRLAEKEKKKAAQAAEEQRNGKRAAQDQHDRPSKIAKSSGLKSTSVPQSAVIPDEYLPPNKILFLQNVPEDYTVEGLTAIFGRFEGFKEVRTVPGRKGIAFVEYDAEAGAVSAKESTGGMTLGDRVIKVTYQRQ
ncbi:Putative RNA recognition domain-containing protein [[Torrubiella] hemipterigena]|uniref:Putative RNA recognition domain-containing protein n=1 Tax=[Torrubiella] hemipterigena TaxID=1531966 RepID=A0A0A1TB41_9HYPO|nr:Putative RNA recognition domain-containing protein [[Torrubiella] hemipterigena]